MTWQAVHETPIGKVIISANDQALTGIHFPTHRGQDLLTPEWKARPDHPLLTETSKQLDAYFGGELREFDLPVYLDGTDFQLEVWGVLRKIPYGKTVSYVDIAKEIGNVARAVGQANACNPISIVLPCHRVIAADQSLGGYAGGLEVKQYLLNMEAKYGFGQGELF